ncbi:MAG: GNAT family protein [Ferruginibacter sp.]
MLNNDINLENDRARLEVLEEKHYEVLLPIAMQTSLWKFTSAKINSPSDFRKYFDTAIAEKEKGSSIPFAIFDKLTQKYAGCTRFGNISEEHQRLEIGWTWYAEEAQRTGLNRACKFLLLSYCFETLGFNRVELKTSMLNEKSKTAMQKIGALKEGVFRKHMINDDGTVRDSVFFSFIKDEWPFTKDKYFSSFLNSK